MGELKIQFKSQTTHYFLATVSIATLSFASFGAAHADGGSSVDQPTVWIELGGQLERIEGQGQIFSPGFVANYPDSVVLNPVSPTEAEKASLFSFAEEGKLTFQPRNSNWIFSGAVRYGRSSHFKEVDNQTKDAFYASYKYGAPNGNPRGIEKFSDTRVRRQQSHSVVDFSAGRDVGLGILGKNGSSVLNVGVRIAQFSSSMSFDVRARPDLKFYDITFGPALLHLPYFHTYHATGHASRSFHGIGPSVSWNASTTVFGAERDVSVSFDWGVNAAILFGRQRADVGHQELGRYVTKGFVLNGQYFTAYRQPSVGQAGHTTGRSLAIPNVGAFAGATYRVENFKLSVGYRADFFFGAIDGGIDERRSEALGFYGPFATISMGLGG